MWWQQGFASNKKKKSNNNKNFIKKSKIKEHQSWEIFLSISRIEPNAAYMKAAYFLPKKEKKKKAAYSDTLNNAWPILENIKARLWHRNPSACTHRWLVHTFSRQTTNFKFFLKKIIIMFTKTNTQVKAVKVKWLAALPTCIFPNQKWKQYQARSWNENCKADFPDIGTCSKILTNRNCITENQSMNHQTIIILIIILEVTCNVLYKPHLFFFLSTSTLYKAHEI